MAAIVSGDILFKYSVAAAAGNTTAGSANTSLGDQISTTQWAGGALNDLFDDISGAENAASTDDYRCIFVHNSNTANALQNAVVYIQSEVAGGASISLAADTTAASAITSGSAQALQATNETTGPQTSLSYSSPTNAASGVPLGTIPANQCKAFWIKRHAANTSALSNDGVTIAVAGDTGSL